MAGMAFSAGWKRCNPQFKIFTVKKDIIYFILFIIPTLSVDFIYLGQLFFLEKFPGNPVINSMIIFISDFSSAYISGKLMNIYPRKKLIIVFYIISTLASIVFPFIKDNILLAYIMLTINTFAICINYPAVFVYASEIFDVDIRNSAVGLLLIISNFVIAYEKPILDCFYSPYNLYAIVCAASGIAIYMIDKETFVPQSDL